MTLSELAVAIQCGLKRLMMNCHDGFAEPLGLAVLVTTADLSPTRQVMRTFALIVGTPKGEYCVSPAESPVAHKCMTNGLMHDTEVLLRCRAVGKLVSFTSDEKAPISSIL